MGKWITFIKERFSPGAYLPMILVFTAVNGLYACQASTEDWHWSRFILTLILVLSFFFRLRLFDEIKDYEVDLKINPTRPLARGLIKISEVKQALILLIGIELAISFYLGWDAFLIHVLAISFSLLMYEEFFMGDLLRPHLTTYAVTHTFSSFLLAMSAAVAVSALPLEELPANSLLFFLMNWCFFNLFEFARKTYASSEERDTVPSYSKIFGRAGAWALSLSQAAIGVGLIMYLSFNYLILAAFAGYLVISLGYLFKNSPGTAKLFRNISGVYLLVHYILLVFLLRV